MLARTKLAAYGVEICGPVEGRNGDDLLARLTGRRALHGIRPRRSARAPRRRARSRVARGCDHLHVSGYALMARARAERRAPCRRARARRRRTDQRRPRLLERDPIDGGVEVQRGRSRRCAPTSCSPTRTRSASSVAQARRRLDPQARRARLLVRRRRASCASRRARSSTRRAQATRSRPDGSSADPISPSRRPRAAFSSSERCR